MMNIFKTPEPLKPTDLVDKYRRLHAAYQKQKAETESLRSAKLALEGQVAGMKREIERAVESAKKAVMKARTQQKNSKERAQRLTEKLRKLEAETG